MANKKTNMEILLEQTKTIEAMTNLSLGHGKCRRCSNFYFDMQSGRCHKSTCYGWDKRGSSCEEGVKEWLESYPDEFLPEKYNKQYHNISSYQEAKTILGILKFLPDGFMKEICKSCDRDYNTTCLEICDRAIIKIRDKAKSKSLTFWKYIAEIAEQEKEKGNDKLYNRLQLAKFLNTI